MQRGFWLWLLFLPPRATASVQVLFHSEELVSFSL